MGKIRANIFKRNLLSVIVAVLMIFLEVGQPAFASKKSQYITVDGKQIEVVTYQKNGSDKDNIVWVFTGDGYTSSDINKLESDLEGNIKKFFDIEPYKSFKDRINIYIAKVVSDGDNFDQYNSNTVYGTYIQYGRMALNTAKGEDFINKVKSEIDSTILDTKTDYLTSKKSGIDAFQIMANSYSYFGTALIYGQKSIVSKGAYGNACVHELSHSLGAVDEYPSWDYNDINVTSYMNPDYMPWKEFLGYRGVGIFAKNGYPRYRSTLYCIMNDALEKELCAVCEAYLFRQLNEKLGSNMLPLYYGAIETTTVEGSDIVHKTDCYMDVHAQSYNVKTIDSNNLISVKGKEIEARTVAINFLNESQDVTINLVIKKSDGTIKHEYSETYTLDAYEKGGYYSDVQKKSLRVKTDALNDLESTDTIETFITTNDASAEDVSTTTQTTSMTEAATETSTESTTEATTESTTKATTKSTTQSTTQSTTKATTSETTQASPEVSLKSVYRLYHSGLRTHFYTTDANERDTLKQSGWTYEGEAWKTSTQAGSPVYRLYHSGLNIHLYTTDINEYQVLATGGWQQEGVAYQSSGNIPVYRLYHTGLQRYHFTKDVNEYKTLATQGWRQEGIAWYSEQ